MKTVLHITAHMGGGVGRALSSMMLYPSSEFVHRILLLENPEQTEFYDLCVSGGVYAEICPSLSKIEHELQNADIVQLEWWHHPLMMKLFIDFPQIPVRHITWSHVSGCNYPYMPFNFAEQSNIVFTSSYSLENPYWNHEQKINAVKLFPVINSVAELSQFERIDYREHSNFTVGYVGTLSFSKLNSRFDSYCGAVDIPAKFVVVGGPENNALKRIPGLEVLGYARDVSAIMAQFDVFGYILNPLHFGTTENVLLEAMAAGLCIVVLDQCTEKHIIKHMETGLLVHSPSEYADAIRYLYKKPEERKRLGKNARQNVREVFSLHKTVELWEDAYHELLKNDKKYFKLDCMSTNAWRNFLIFTPPDLTSYFACGFFGREDFEKKIGGYKYIFQESGKSSIQHFARCFPEVYEFEKLLTQIAL